MQRDGLFKNLKIIVIFALIICLIGAVLFLIYGFAFMWQVMAATITTLIMGNPDIDFVYTHIIDGRDFSLDTREIKTEMEDLSLTDPLVIHQLTKTIRNSLQQLESEEGDLESKEAKNGKADN